MASWKLIRCAHILNSYYPDHLIVRWIFELFHFTFNKFLSSKLNICSYETGEIHRNISYLTCYIHCNIFILVSIYKKIAKVNKYKIYTNIIEYCGQNRWALILRMIIIYWTHTLYPIVPIAHQLANFKKIKNTADNIRQTMIIYERIQFISFPKNIL